MIQKRRFQIRIAKIFFGSGFFVGGRGIDLLGVVEDQDATVVEQDLLGRAGATPASEPSFKSDEGGTSSKQANEP